MVSSMTPVRTCYGIVSAIKGVNMVSTMIVYIWHQNYFIWLLHNFVLDLNTFENNNTSTDEKWALIADAPSGCSFIIMVIGACFANASFANSIGKPRRFLWRAKYAMFPTESSRQELPHGIYFDLWLKGSFDIINYRIVYTKAKMIKYTNNPRCRW